MSKLFSAIKLIRPVNCLITFLCIGVMSYLCLGKGRIGIIIFLASSAGFCVAAAGNIINDILDFDIDKINRPERILPSGKISISTAYALIALFSIASVLLALWINIPSLFIVILSLAMLYLYSLNFKGIPLIGNLVVSSLTALAFIFAGTSVENVIPSLVPAAFALLINFIREIVKDMEDIDGDRQNNIPTFPVKFGFQKSQSVILTATIILILFTFVPFVFRFYKIEYFITVTFVNIILVYFIKSIREDSTKKNLGKLSSLLKTNMILGLAAIYMGM